MKILVTGGCGYIGSHTIVDLISQGYEVVSVDNLCNAEANVMDHVFEVTGVRVQNYEIDLCNLDATEKIFRDHSDIKGIIHFAALKYVGESTSEPLKYFNNNINSLINVLECQSKYEVPHFIFSSSCSVYGNPDQLPVTENTPFKEAESPYARTKQFGEQIIRDVAKQNKDLNYILLRYFNPAGIHKSGIIREKAKKEAETLVPIVEEVYNGTRDKLVIFGGDYPTRDGTCVRDYIHIMDLADAHTKAVKFLEKSDSQGKLEVYNLGVGEGVTVLEMVKAMEKVSGKSINHEIGNRRDGDVVAVYSDYKKANKDLGWQPQYNIEDIFASII